MVRKAKRIISMLMALAMIFSSVSISEKTVHADTNESSVVYAGNYAYDKTSGHLYELVNSNTKWEDAKNAAEKKGGYLVCISSADENEMVRQWVNNVDSNISKVWLGLHRKADTPAEWYWLDESEVSYTNWASGEPNSQDEKAGELYIVESGKNGKWNDATESSTIPYVIEYNACSHPDSQRLIKNRTLTDCEQGGYTGDTICGMCDYVISKGTTVDPCEHGVPVLDSDSVIKETCTTDGFSGNYICPTCEKILTPGSTIYHQGHKETETVRDARKASCFYEGYSGDTYCTECDETMTQGSKIDKLEHDFEDDVCKNCGMIKNAQIGTTYSLKITDDLIIQVMQFTVPNTGNYTIIASNESSYDTYGHLLDEYDYNEDEIAEELHNYYEKGNNFRLDDYIYRDDDSGGKSQPKIEAKLNKDKTYYFILSPYGKSKGGDTVDVTITCNHGTTHIADRTLTDCEAGGYTGDVVCDICNTILERGKTIAAGSEHGDPVLDNDSVKEATCTIDGFTGNYICSQCGKVLTPGNVIEHDGHKQAKDLRNVVEANCYRKSYTGDTYCSVCDETITAGNTGDTTEHEFEEGICKHCGMINDAQPGTKYTMETTENQLVKVVKFKAPFDGKFAFKCSNNTPWVGYGYLFDSDNFSDAMIISKLADFYSGEVRHIRFDNYIDCKYANGNNGAPEVVAQLKKDEVYYFVVAPKKDQFGSFEFIVSCSHESTHIENKTFTDCTIGGYTGDVVCDVCNETVEKGTTIEPKASHAEAVLDKDSVIEVTCTTDGFTGNYLCPDCGQTITAGTKVQHEGHVNASDFKNQMMANCYQEGYTGDTYCEECDEVIAEGMVMNKINHEYEDGICKHCGRLSNAIEDETYVLKTTYEQRYQVIEFTPERSGYFQFYCENLTDWDGYGWLYSEDNYSDNMIADALNGYGRYLFEDYLDCNDDSGRGDAPAISYTLEKGKKYYLIVGPYNVAYGTFAVTIGCGHMNAHIENATLQNCTLGGYTGDYVCDDCHEIVSKGMNIPAGSEHNFSTYHYSDATCVSYEYTEYKCTYCGETKTEVNEEDGYGTCSYELVGYVEPTCTTAGCEGHEECIYCGKKGYGDDKVIKPYHAQQYYMIEEYMKKAPTCENEGYTGDTICEKCGEIIEKGEAIPAVKHNFIDGICNHCGISKQIQKELTDGYYLIKTIDDLIDFMVIQDEYPDAGIKGKLMNDIAFPENFVDVDNVIGQTAIVGSELDGNGHTISGINVQGVRYPLFEAVDESMIKNLNIDNSNVTCKSQYDVDIAYQAINSNFVKVSASGRKDITAEESSYICSALFVTAEECLFDECKNNADIYATGSVVTAGITISAKDCQFNKCENNGKRMMETGTTASITSGLVLAASDTWFTECINNGDVTVYEKNGTYNSSNVIVGGIVILIERGKLDKCTNNGDMTSSVYVTSSSENMMAGIVCSAQCATITDCKNFGALKTSYEAYYMITAGIAGYLSGYSDEKTQVNNCENTGIIEGCKVAGIVGKANNTNVKKCTNKADIKSNGYAAGLVGDMDYNVMVCECQNNGNIQGDYSAAGIVYDIEDSIVDDCINNGDITSKEYAGGIIAEANYTKVTYCINNGDIYGEEYAGGIIASGYCNTVLHCVNNGNVYGLYCVGGICGADADSIFDYVYNTGLINNGNQATYEDKLVNGYGNTKITNSEEEHIHDFGKNQTTATTERDGYIDGKCSCGFEYKGAISKIATVDISKTKYDYTGQNIDMPKITVTNSADKIIDARYYTVIYRNRKTGAVVSQIKEIGTYEAVVTFNSLYSGEVVRTFIVADTSDANNNNNGATTVKPDNNDATKNNAKVTKPSKVKKVKVKKTKKRVSIKWKKIKKVKGYQVKYATNKKMKKAKFKFVTKNKFVIKKAKSKKYFIRVRAYKLDTSGKKIFGKWSAKKTVKVK